MRQGPCEERGMGFDLASGVVLAIVAMNWALGVYMFVRMEAEESVVLRVSVVDRRRLSGAPLFSIRGNANPPLRVVRPSITVRATLGSEPRKVHGVDPS